MSIPTLKNAIAQAYVRPTDKAPLRTTARADGQGAQRLVAPIVADRRSAPPVQISLSAEALRVLGEVERDAPRPRPVPPAESETSEVNATRFAGAVEAADAPMQPVPAPAPQSGDAPRPYSRPGSLLDIRV